MLAEALVLAEALEVNKILFTQKKVAEEKKNSVYTKKMVAEALEARFFHIFISMNKAWMYILECCDGSFYTGSTIDLERRLLQHQNGEGANHTKKRLPVKLIYSEEYQRIDTAFYREKQVQGWNRTKKMALINGEYEKLPELSIAYRDIE